MPSPSQEALAWEKVLNFFKEHLTDGDPPNLDTILFLIGVQELGMGHRRYKKDEKVNLMHIAVCRLLEPYGYYRFEGKDADGWPHFEVLEQLPQLKANEQTLLMKKAIIQYFETQGLI
ncbi:hypothetical protein [Ornithobacterium rhinotracheale]|uniref:hypothetical protein n=1 Tax=Ornithobacterium rhinotracheale TaxID=28251 RepID=UPI0040373609